MRSTSLFGLAGFLSLSVTLAAFAQPAAPSKAEEYLGAFSVTFEQGKYDLAAEYLKAYLETNPTDAQLLDIERRYGKGAFQNLLAVPKWSDNAEADKAARETVKALTDRVRAAANKILLDPARITKFVRNLGESYGERLYAIGELRRTGDAVVPFMVKVFREAPSPNLEAGILDAITKLDPSVVAGWLGAMEGFTHEQRYNVLTAILSRSDAQRLTAFADTDFTPYLWYLAALPADEMPLHRKLALAALGQLVPGNVAKIDAVDQLVRLARLFQGHKTQFRTGSSSSPAGVILWRWDAAKSELVRTSNVPVVDAEEYYGLRYARWALERRPHYEPAARILLTIAADRAIARSAGKDLARSAPAVHRLLSDTPTPMLADLLTEALARKQGNLVLAFTQTLADRADTSVTASQPGKPSLLVRALEYPDARVQLAAANGLLRAPNQLTHEIRATILKIIKGAAGSDLGVSPDSKGMALVVDPNRMRNDSLAAFLRFIGYNVEQYAHGRDVLRRLGEGSDYDIVLVDRHVPDPQLNDFLSQVRADVKSGGVPVAVVASTDKPVAPTVDGLLLRFAILIAATETDGVEIPAPFAPNLRNIQDDNDRLRAASLLQRDAALRTAARNRMARLSRVIDNSNLNLSSPQRALLDHRIEQVTWAVLGAQYPITAMSAPETTTYLNEFARRVTLQPVVAPYNQMNRDGLFQRIERLQIDVDEQPVIKARYDKIRAALDMEALGLDLGNARDLAAEVAVAKLAQRYPNVSVIASPYSRVGFEEDLQKAYQDSGRTPRDPAEKQASARLAIEWLQKMASGELKGFDINSANVELRSALGSNDLAPTAIEAISHIKTGEAQQALLNLALSGTRPAPIRAKAADAAIRHIQANGKMIPKVLIDTNTAAANDEPDVEVRAKLVVLKGILSFDAEAFQKELQTFTPSVPPIPMPKGM